MENMFQDFTTESAIFENKEVLRPNYIPENLPHRAKQIKSLADILSAALKGETPSNIFIYGKTGTGKTATVKYVSKELEEMGEKTSSKCSLIYINGEIFDTQYRVFAYIARAFNKHVPMVGWPTDMVYLEIKTGIDGGKKCVIVILDEVDKLVSKGDEALYNLSRINSELNNSRLSIIGISNDLTFMELLDPRVRSSLSEEEIIFPPYNANQLKDILGERVEKAFNSSVLDGEVIPLCAAFAAQENGDARSALDLLRVSGEVAERSKSKKVTEEHVRLASEKMEKNRIIEVVKTLPVQSKIILNTVIRLNKANAKRRFSSGEVYNTYRKLCSHLKIEALSQRRVSALVSELDILGLINAAIISKGRYGRTREISLSVPEESVQHALVGYCELETLSTIKLKTQVALCGYEKWE
ncbi:MAG: ORC1-type DNA replication protein [Candidatus Syntrophoarchaeum sp.]|nr:ORC1-type DNA replication protein [Methanomicrobia archaeon]MBL7117827.1 ORC1-type DNA replication protein [Candidatus Syntrophoarchaeum sp.]